MIIETVKIEELNLDKENARRHPDKNLAAIKGSLKRYGQQKPIVVGEGDVVIAGNGTLQAARELGWTEINVVKTKLTGRDARAYALADNRTTDTSEWDDEVLGKILQDLYEHDYPIAEIGFDPGDYDLGAGGTSSEDVYTGKIEAPIYEPKGEKPNLSDIFNVDKAKALIKEIEASPLSKDEKEFLKYAAYRHISFNYEQVAEYYAHASKDTQTLMEKSALVIIDFKQAIENGFIEVSKDLAETYESA